MSPAAVLVDCGGVLLQPAAERVLATLRPFGATACDAPDVDRAHHAANNDPDAVDYWQAFVTRLGVPSARAAQAAETLVTQMEPSWWSRPYDEPAAALRALAARGLRVAIVSNSDGTVERLLQVARICQVGEGPGVAVDAVIDSLVVGVEKPDPRIFAIALERLGGVAPGATVHVGDTVAADVRGARAAGIRPVHLDPFGDCAAPGDHEHVRTLHELPAAL